MPAKGQRSSAAQRQASSISIKRRGIPNNPAKTNNLVKYSDVLGLTPKEWNDRMIRTRAIKTALQMNLLQAAVDAGLEKLMAEAITERNVEKADLLERICKIIGATFRDQVGQPGVQVNVSGGAPSKPLSIKFTDAQEVKDNQEVKENGDTIENASN